MPGERWAPEVFTAYAAAMGTELAEHVLELQARVMDLQLRWALYTELFLTSKQRVDLLKEVVDGPAHDLANGVRLRIVDPANPRRHLEEGPERRAVVAGARRKGRLVRRAALGREDEAPRADRLLDATAALTAATREDAADYCITPTEAMTTLRARIAEVLGKDAVEVVIDPKLSAKAAASASRIRLRGDVSFSDQDVHQLIEHELALVKVRATNHNRAEVLRIIELYKGRVIDVSPDSLIVEHSGTEQEIDSLVALLAGFGIRELVRTGTVAMGRGSNVVDVEGILRAGTVPAVPEGVAASAAPSHTSATEE